MSKGYFKKYKIKKFISNTLSFPDLNCENQIFLYVIAKCAYLFIQWNYISANEFTFPSQSWKYNLHTFKWWVKFTFGKTSILFNFGENWIYNIEGIYIRCLYLLAIHIFKVFGTHSRYLNRETKHGVRK